MLHKLRHIVARWLFKLVCRITPHGSATFTITTSNGAQFIVPGFKVDNGHVDCK